MTDTDEQRAREKRDVFNDDGRIRREIIDRSQMAAIGAEAYISITDVMREIATARAEERERCARIAEAGGRKLIAAAIRTAGDAP